MQSLPASEPCAARGSMMLRLSLVLGALAVASPQPDNWAVIVSTSRFWFNYRHMANALGIYRLVRRLGIPDSQIVLMLAEDVGCNARNVLPGEVYADSGVRSVGLLGGDPSADTSDADGAGRHGAVEVDYRGLDVNAESFTRLLTGRHAPGTPPSRQLRSGENSNVLIYITGHGGDEFMKFHDYEEMGSSDLAWAVEEMHLKRRYGRLMLIADTCQAGTLAKTIRTPGVVSIASSHLGESSYSSSSDQLLGLSLLDRFTEAALRFFDRKMTPRGGAPSIGTATLKMLLSSIDAHRIRSNPQVRDDLWTDGPAAKIALADFFSARRGGEVVLSGA